MNTINQERIAWLLSQIQYSKASPQELQELLDFMEADPSPGIISQVRDFFADDDRPVPALNMDDPDWQSVMQQVLLSDKPSLNEAEAAETPVPRIPSQSVFRKWGWIAASILIIATAGWLFFNNKQPKKELPVVQIQDKPPGRNGAILTLTSGKQLVLDSIVDGIIAREFNTDLSVQNNQLIYQETDNRQQSALSWNTLSTPRGRQYRLRLPDGSAVWLNAASSIRYPVAFYGNERKVELSGEAYFEISKNPMKPFIVTTAGGEEIEVLGTQFNIKAYSDEPESKVTLLQGAVVVKKTTRRRILLPGQQAACSASGITVDKVDTTAAIAWKNELFDFSKLSFEEIMRQVSRWYDIDIVYTNGVPKTVFEGKIGRDVSLSKLIAFFRESGIDARLQNNQLIINSP